MSEPPVMNPRAGWEAFPIHQVSATRYLLSSAAGPCRIVLHVGERQYDLMGLFTHDGAEVLIDEVQIHGTRYRRAP